MFLFSKKENQWIHKSYSQTGEDLIMRFILDGLKIDKPTYIDIGAHHPFYINNTALFYEKGSRGVNIEPDPSLYKAFVEHRRHDINLNIGVGDVQGEMVLKVFNASSLNTFSDEEAEKMVTQHKFKIVNRIPVKILTVKDVVDKYLNGRFPDFISIDVEGLDERIVRSIDLVKDRPLVFCIETISYSERGRGEKSVALIEYLKQCDYMVFADTYINTIFVDKRRWIR